MTKRTVSVQVDPAVYRLYEHAQQRFKCLSMSAFCRLALSHLAGHYATGHSRAQRPRRGSEIDERGVPAAKGESLQFKAPAGLPERGEVASSNGSAGLA